MSETQLITYVRRALDLLDRGEALDLEQLCHEHPELRPAVAEALGIREDLRADDDAALAAGFAPPPDPRIGRLLGDGRYRIESILGRGGMGVVYAATDLELDREVAIKLFARAAGAESAADHERFAREARMLASLDHAHVVAIFDRGRESDGSPFVVMERLRGLPMSALLSACDVAIGPETIPQFGPWWSETWRESCDVAVEDTPPIPAANYLRTVVGWLADVASGLVAAHDRGIVHRDVKPSNIFIRATSTAVLIDFGIAMRHGDAALTATHASIGTPSFMAPEQLADSVDAVRDRPTIDVYGLCATLYCALALQPPYAGSAAAVIASIQNSEPTSLRKLRPELPRDLTAIVEHGMHVDPARRYQTMRELETDLRAFLDHRPVHARHTGPLGRLMRSARRRPARAIATAAIGLLLPIAALLLWFALDARSRERQEELATLISSLPRLLAVDGTAAQRAAADPGQLRVHLARLDRILELDPTAHLYRAFCAALHHDLGDREHAESRWRELAHAASSPHLAALAKDGEAGAESAPRPTAPLERAVAALCVLRARTDFAELPWAKRALDLLEGVDADLAARDLRLVALASVAETVRKDAVVAVERMFAEAGAVAAQRGRPTATTLGTQGYALAHQRRWNEAAVLLEQADALCPGQFDVLQNLANAYRRSDRIDLAEQCYRRAVELRPDIDRPYHLLAGIRTDQGDFADARRIAADLPIPDRSREWLREDLLGTIARREATATLASDPLRARELAETAVSHFDRAAAAAANEADRAKIAARGALAAALASGEWDRAAIDMLDAMALSGASIDDPYHLENVALVLSQTSFDAALRTPLERFLYRLARTLAPGDTRFGARQIERIRATTDR